jgi:hypothetical protein
MRNDRYLLIWRFSANAEKDVEQIVKVLCDDRRKTRYIIQHRNSTRFDEKICLLSNKLSHEHFSRTFLTNIFHEHFSRTFFTNISHEHFSRTFFTNISREHFTFTFNFLILTTAVTRNEYLMRVGLLSENTSSKSSSSSSSSSSFNHETVHFTPSK